MLGVLPQTLRSVLFIGAHCDDIEIGCGATVQKLLADYPQLEVHWVVLASNPVRAAEARRSAEMYLSDCVHKTIDIQAFRNGYFPYIGEQIKDYFERLKVSVQPDVIFTHHGGDYHQDHRVTAELTWNTFRDHLILEYEIPKYDGGMGSPNLFIPVTRIQVETKVNRLLDCFVSESTKRWFTPETFAGLMRLRGVECNAMDGYAEAFYCRKIIFQAD